MGLRLAWWGRLLDTEVTVEAASRIRRVAPICRRGQDSNDQRLHAGRSIDGAHRSMALDT